MALTRKMLKEMGISDENIDMIIAAHREVVNDLQQYRDDALKLPTVQKELDALKQAASADSSYKEKFEKEHADFEKYKADVQKETDLRGKRELYRKILQDAGIDPKRVDTIIRITNLDEMEVSDGEFKDRKKLLDAVKVEWADFIVSTSVEGVKPENPPANVTGPNFTSMSLSDKMVYANEHPNAPEVIQWLKNPVPVVSAGNNMNKG